MPRKEKTVKVKIKMNVPKPPTGISGITFFGACYKWNNVFYRMGEEYTINKEDFNPAIMVDLSPRKKIVPKVEKEADAEVELNTSDEVPTEVQDEVEISTEETPTPLGEGGEAVGKLSSKFEASAKERKPKKK